MADSLVSPRGRPQASPTVALPRIPAGPLPQTPSQGDDPEKRPFRPRREVLQQPAGPLMPSPSGAPPSPGKFIAAQKPASRGRPSTILLGDHTNGPAVRQPMMGRGGPPSQPPHHHHQQQPQQQPHAQGQEHGPNGNGVAAGAGPRRAPPPRGGPGGGGAGGGSNPVPRLAAPEGARPTQPLPASPSPRKPLQRLQSDPAISTSPAPSSPPSSSSSSSSGSPSVNMKTLPPRRQLVKRDAIDPSGGLEFPIKVWLPDDTQSLFKCPHKCTCYEFIEIIIEHTKQTYMGTLLKSKKLELRVDESNSPLDISKPLFELPYVQDTLEKKLVPTLRLCLTGANHRQSFIINSNTAVQAETARLTIQFQVHFLLPGGKNLSLNCHGDQTLHQIKEFVCAEAKTQRGLLMLAAKHYMFLTWHGKQELTIEAMPLEQVSYIHKSRKRCIIPKLILQQRPCKHFTEKELEKRGSVNQLIGKPIISTHSDEEEISAFRQTMARLRYLERLRKKDSQSSSSAESSQSISRNKGLQASIPNKTMVLVTLPELTVKKTIQTLENETANQFLERIFDKHYAATFKTKTAQDYILKVAGLKEFITGDHPVNTFDYVRRKVLKNEKVELVVVEKASVANEAELQEEDLEEQFLGEGEEMLEACAFHYSHDEIAQKNIPWDQKTYISIWELTDQPFRLKIMGVESLGAYCTNFSEATRGKFSNFYVTAGLYHGGELLDSLNVTFTTTIDPNPRWNQWLIFKICTANIPRATRVCFTLYATNRHEASADRKGDIPVAWVNCQLINFKHELLTGVQPLNMWPDAEANPIGTCVQNSSSMAPVLFVTFEEFQLPVVFPDDPPSDLKIGKNEVLGEAGFEFLQIIPKVENLILKDPLYPLTAEDRANIWKCRYVCQTKPKSLPKLIASIPQGNRDAILELHRLLATWKPLHHYDAMELLDSRFADSKVRSFAVKCLDAFEDSDLQQYLLQLVQVLKYEPYHDSALIRFLIRRALSSQHVGHAFFWYLKSEMHVPEICKRFGLFLEAYLYGCGQHLDDLTRQDEIMNAFCTVANNIKLIPAADRREVMLAQLAQIRLPDRFQLPLDRTWEASGLILEKCRFMDSKKLPLWLVFVNSDPNGSPLTVIFKSGDDLRQDMLTLQIIRIMDQLWKEEGLDLQLSPYGCISTGDGIGMIEVVLNSATTAQITKESGGAAAAFKASPIADWLRTNNPSDAQYSAAVNRFILSCAGYCVATYVLGIGDRHNDNIMVSRNGRLFHIDFGHFLGNYKKKFGIKRERAKFVLTPDFAHVMGGVGSPGFTTFQNTCCRAFNILRKHASKFINLFAMMLSTGIPELREAQDIEYLRQSICFGMSDEEANEYFHKLIHDSLGTFTTQVNNYIHILAH